ncbi:hypothetical protein GQ600_23665 [Phytophthora cactorum]|nr:hypothetical protein GQ600_23665 [Phytophthora cactorum]
MCEGNTFGTQQPVPAPVYEPIAIHTNTAAAPTPTK